MRSFSRAIGLGVVLLSCSTALAAPPAVQAFAGAAGGVATHDVPGVCSIYGAPDVEATFFPSSATMSVPQGGIGGCGYSGDAGSTIAATGPIVASQSVGPVLLGNAGYAGTYTGSARATARFKVLEAAAHGVVTLPGAGSPVALGNASAAALFDDTFTASSPHVPAGSTGYVRYTFAFEGSLSTLGVPVPYVQAIANATLRFEHDNGPNFELVRVDAMRGSLGTLHSLDGTTGSFVAATGSIAGAGNFTSALVGGFGQVIDQQITWGQPFRFRAGLMATVYGDGDANFASTARLVRIDLFDASHALVSDAIVGSASGTSYADVNADAGAGAGSDAGAGGDATPADGAAADTASDGTASDVQADAASPDAQPDAGAADATPTDTQTDAGAADAGSGATPADGAAADAALGGGPAPAAPGGGCSCATAGAGGGVPVLVLLVFASPALGARLRGRRARARRLV